MPRRAQMPRLILEAAERGSDGKINRHAAWVIRDRGRKIRTGCREAEAEEARRKLALYILESQEPSRERNRNADQVKISDVISVYAEEVAPGHGRPRETAQRLDRLLDYFGTRRLSAVTGAACRAYLARRGSVSAARRELEDLRAAIKHYHKEGYVSMPVAVTLPERSDPRSRWLTRDEAARLIRAAWRMRQSWRGKESDRRTGQHIARFILVALYTGTRAGAVCAAAIRPTVGRGYIDLEQGVFYRRAPGSRETKKRQTPAPLPDRLVAHLRRWERKGLSRAAVVEWNGHSVGRIHKGFRAARRAAGLGADVTPHTLRHTAATWLMQQGCDLWEAAGFLGMTVQTLEATYGHHHTRHLEGARQAMSARPGRDHYRDGSARTESEQRGARRVAN